MNFVGKLFRPIYKQTDVLIENQPDQIVRLGAHDVLLCVEQDNSYIKRMKLMFPDGRITICSPHWFEVVQ